MDDHVSLRFNFRCPKCGGPHFGSLEEDDGVNTYVCHGKETYGDREGGWGPCGWEGNAEDCFTVPMEKAHGSDGPDG